MSINYALWVMNEPSECVQLVFLNLQQKGVLELNIILPCRYCDAIFHNSVMKALMRAKAFKSKTFCNRFFFYLLEINSHCRAGGTTRH